jgi:O-methyltransferase
LKKALTFALWDEPLFHIETRYSKLPAYQRMPLKALSRILAIKRLHIVWDREISEDARKDGRAHSCSAHTMLGLKRLDNLQFCIEAVINDGIEGDLIETGVWRGGACIFMRGVLAAHDINDRRVFVADSFNGLPKPDDRYPADKGDQHHKDRYLAVSKEEVENNFRKYGLLDGQVVFLKGWFKDSLPNAPIKRLSILRLDGDMYESTRDALTNLYPKLSVGGFCIVDDYS